MPQAATISLEKGDLTTYDFNVSKRLGESVWFTNTSESATSAGQPELSVTYSGSSPQRKTDKCLVRLALPKEHLVDDVYKVDDIARAHIDLRIPETLTATERADFYAALNSLVANATVKAMIEDAEGFY